MYTCIVDSLCCTVETKYNIESNLYSQLKKHDTLYYTLPSQSTPQFYKDQDTVARSTLAQPGKLHCPPAARGKLSPAYIPPFLQELLLHTTGCSCLKLIVQLDRRKCVFPTWHFQTTTKEVGKASGQGRRLGPNTQKPTSPAVIWSSVSEPRLTSRGNTLHCNLSCMNYTYGCQ